MSKIYFGPAGAADRFAELGFKATLQMPGYLEDMGLTAFEYQAGRGVKISDDTAAALGRKAVEHKIKMSLHAPYYISLSGADEEKRLGSIRYILQAAKAAHHMGASRIVVHTGSVSGMSRGQALELAKDTMTKAIAAVDDAGFGHVHICPEVMGKINQLGTLEEVTELCKLDERLIPCIDFGHLNARTAGSLKGQEDFRIAISHLENHLGEYRGKNFHVHFSRIEYTEKGGEKRHLTFEDKEFGPDYRHMLDVMHEKGATPTIICESRGTQDIDAAEMQAYYNALDS